MGGGVLAEGRPSGARTGNPAAQPRHRRQRDPDPGPANATTAAPTRAAIRRPRRGGRAGAAGGRGPAAHPGPGPANRPVPWGPDAAPPEGPDAHPSVGPWRAPARAAAVPGWGVPPARREECRLPCPTAARRSRGSLPGQRAVRSGRPFRRTASVATFVVRCASRAAASWRAASTGADGRNAFVGDRRNSCSMAPSARAPDRAPSGGRAQRVLGEAACQQSSRTRGRPDDRWVAWAGVRCGRPVRPRTGGSPAG